jgi:NAD(P)-dependent dehydrogenase (short-subunit alcohol dehydrogenase family)
MTPVLEGRTALVTGASSDGFGAHFARVLANAGAEIVLAARRRDRIERLALDLGRNGAKARCVTMDVTDTGSVAAALAEAGPVDILVNNAGTTHGARLLDQTEYDYDRVINTNMKGAWTVATQVARQMRDGDIKGSIINIASITGLRPADAIAPYAISKAALIQMTRQMGLELARYGIRVNALAPGYFSTDLNRDFFETDAGKKMIARVPMRRLGHYEDLDGPLLLLASDASRFMTGAVIPVDGGHLVNSL